MSIHDRFWTVLKYETVAVVLVLGCLAVSCGRDDDPVDGTRDLVISDVAVVHPDSASVAQGWIVAVSDGVISAAGPSSELAVPRGVRRIDGRGYFLMPGLIDMHAHVDESRDLPLYLANGITTLRNMKGDSSHLRLREEIARGQLLGPTIYTAGPFTNEPWVRTAEDARGAAREQSAASYDFIKVHDEISAGACEALIVEGRRLGIPVVGHPPPNLSLDLILRLKPQTLEHVEDYTYTLFQDLAPSPAVDRWAEAIARSRVAVTPTLVAYASLVAQVENVDSMLSAPSARYASPWQRLVRDRDHNPYRRMFSDTDLPHLRKSREFQRMLVARLHQAGARVLAGTDACNVVWNCGSALHDELESFVALGFTAAEALRSATSDAAQALGREQEIGTIAAGRRADLVLLSGDPLADIRNTRRIVGVVARGRWLSLDTLKQLLNNLAGAYDREEALAAEIAKAPMSDIVSRRARLDTLSRTTSSRLLIDYRAAERFGQLAVAAGPDSARRIIEHQGSAASAPFSEAALNRVGYVLLNRKEMPAAIRVFQLNTLVYPEAFNTWDSLGEAYLAAGDTTSARSVYRRSLELNPNNTNASRVLRGLR